MICEISQNIRYQYNFIILWFFFAVGVVIATLGCFYYLFQHLRNMLWIYYRVQIEGKPLTATDRVHSQLTLREMEYLDKIGQMDMTMYGEILRELIRLKPGIIAIKKYAPQITGSSGTATLIPSAPNDFSYHAV